MSKEEIDETLEEIKKWEDKLIKQTPDTLCRIST